MRPGPHGEFEEVLYFSGQQLHWIFNQMNPMLQNVGMRRKMANIGCIAENQEFLLTTYYTPNNYDPRLRANQRMRLELVAVADNAVFDRIYVEISWDGQWNEGNDEMTRHLVVMQVDEKLPGIKDVFP